MKKSLILLSALAALGLAACGEKPTPTPDPGPDPVPVDVPTAEGKCTFYLTMSDSSVAMQSFGSIYLTGGAFGWKTGYDALELQKLEGDSKVYYVQVANDAFDVTAVQGMEYQLVMGYNHSANMPDASSGLQWVDGRKSDECAAPGGLGNLSFTYTAGDLKVDLGTHTWSNQLPQPAEPLKNYKFVVNFEEAVPEYGSVLIFGSFDGWKTPSGDTAAQCAADHKMTPSEDRKTWTFNNATLVAGDYVCKILVEYNTNVESGAIAWNNVEETPENYAFSVNQADGDGYELEILDGPAHFSLADPNVKIPLAIVVYDIGEGEMTAAGIGVAGSFNGWTIEGNMCEWDDDAEGYVYTYDEGVNGKIEFGVMSLTSWADKCVAEGGANIAVEVDTSYDALIVMVFCDYSKFGVEEQDLPAEQIVVQHINFDDYE